MVVSRSRLVPELDVSNLEMSLTFYVTVAGFTILYTRPEERFAYLDLEGANLMIEEVDGPSRFRTALLERPFGRGVNFQIQVSDVAGLLERMEASGHVPTIPLEDKWYRTDRGFAGNRQFVVPDPDGYLLRFFQDLGIRQE